MPLLAGMLESQFGMKCSIVRAVDPATGAADPKFRGNLEGLDALRDADLAVFFIRFRELPTGQLQQILDYIGTKKPVVGFRVSTHAFLYPSGDLQHWNDDFGKDLFGQKWIHHYGHESTTRVRLKNPGHPILTGVVTGFDCPSWLYHVVPLPDDCHVLASGVALDTKRKVFGAENPVAWTRDQGGRRVFFTTLGHPKDFEDIQFRRMVINGILWSLGMEPQIADATGVLLTLGEWTAPPTH